MPHPISHKYPIPISQLCLVNTDVPAGVGAPPLDTTTIYVKWFISLPFKYSSASKNIENELERLITSIFSKE